MRAELRYRNAFVAILALVFCLISIETGLRWIYPEEPTPSRNPESVVYENQPMDSWFRKGGDRLLTRPGFLKMGSELGQKWEKDTSSTVILKRGDKEIYRVAYSIDSYGRRETPQANKKSKKFAVFLGSSNVFGDGLNDSETLPSAFAQLRQDYRVYNYSSMGYGPNNTWIWVRNIAKVEIPEAEGVVMYPYSYSELVFLICSFRLYNEWCSHMPYLQLNKSGDVEFLGSFQRGRWFSRIFDVLGPSRIVKWTGFDYPKIQDSHYELLMKIFKEMRSTFEDRIGRSKFYVILLPTESLDWRIIDFLKANQIEYRVYQKDQLFPNDRKGLEISEDGHPSAFFNQVLAKALASDIQ